MNKKNMFYYLWNTFSKIIADERQSRSFVCFEVREGKLNRSDAT